MASNPVFNKYCPRRSGDVRTGERGKTDNVINIECGWRNATKSMAKGTRVSPMEAPSITMKTKPRMLGEWCGANRFPTCDLNK